MWQTAINMQDMENVANNNGRQIDHKSTEITDIYVFDTQIRSNKFTQLGNAQFSINSELFVIKPELTLASETCRSLTVS